MRILVFQHLAVEHPGSFRDFWAERGAERTTVELDAGEPIPPLEAFDMLAVMGGPMDSGRRTSTLGSSPKRRRSGAGWRS